MRKVEDAFGQEVQVIGVHSAKFDRERISEGIHQAVLKYGVRHPVVNDSGFSVWRAYGVRAWPTIAVIDPEGRVAAVQAGESPYEALAPFLAAMIRNEDAKGRLHRSPAVLAAGWGTGNPGGGGTVEAVGVLPGGGPAAGPGGASVVSRTTSGLLFPGKLLASEERIFIADSGGNRVVVSDPDGNVKTVIGSGNGGWRDGTFEEACFSAPQGMALAGGFLYVADSESHTIRRIDLARRLVETIAGVGAQGLGPVRSGPARKIPISSPWDLVLAGERLFIALAGSHQIGVFDLEAGEIGPFAGNGLEHLTDGPRLSASFIQPSGLATDGHVLYVADSEASAIRAVPLSDPKGKERVRTIVGVGLFDFGDRDGTGSEVLLQHPLDVALNGGQLYIADTYNHRVKKLDPETGSAARFAGSGLPGREDGHQAEFNEPGGLSILAGDLYVADTNNHAVRIVEIQSARVRTLFLKGL